MDLTFSMDYPSLILNGVLAGFSFLFFSFSCSWAPTVNDQGPKLLLQTISGAYLFPLFLSKFMVSFYPLMKAFTGMVRADLISAYLIFMGLTSFLILCFIFYNFCEDSTKLVPPDVIQKIMGIRPRPVRGFRGAI